MSENKLIQIRRAFKIPDSVLIFASERFNVLPAETGKQPGANKYTIPQGAQPDTPLQVLIYTSIDFKVKQYTDNLGRIVAAQEKGYSSILMTVSQTKRIIYTEIQGRDGTVKEYIGMDDYDVQVNGIITGANGVNPAADVATLKKILDAPVPIEVSSGYLQNLGIFNLVVASYEIGQQIGSYSYQTYSISFKSDIPQELRISGV